MIKIDEDKTIHINRGDRGTIKMTNQKGNFHVGDIIKFSIVEKKNYQNVIFQKKFIVTEESSEYYLTLTKEDTLFGEIISKPVTYWYELEYNNDITIVGYDEDKEKRFILYPEAPNINSEGSGESE